MLVLHDLLLARFLISTAVAFLFIVGGVTQSLGGKAEVVVQIGHSYRSEQAELRPYFSRDGKKIVTVYEDDAKLWDVQSGRLLRTLRRPDENHSNIKAATFTSDGMNVLVLREQFDANNETSWHILEQYEAANGQRKELAQLRSSIHHAAFSANGEKLATAHENGTVAIRIASTGKLLREITVGPDVADVIISSSGEEIAVAKGPMIRVWRTATGAEIAPLSANGAGVRSMAFFPDGRGLLIGLEDGSVVHREHSGKANVLARLEKHSPIVSIDPNGNLLAAIFNDADVQTSKMLVWRSADGKRLREEVFSGDDLFSAQFSVAFSPDGQTVATGGTGVTSLLMDPFGGPRRRLEGNSDGVSHAAFSPDGKAMIWGNGNVAFAWDTYSGVLLRAIRGHTRPIRATAISGDGRLVATGGEDSAIIIREFQTGRQLRQIRVGAEDSGVFIEKLMFSPDGRWLAIELVGPQDATENPFRVAEVRTGKIVARPIVKAELISASAFSPKGDRLLVSLPQVGENISGSEVHIISAPSWTITNSFKLPLDEVEDARFSEDGRQIVAIAAGALIRIDPVMGRVIDRRPLAIGDVRSLLSGAVTMKGNLVAAYGTEETGSELRLLESATGSIARRVKMQLALGPWLRFDPSGNILLVGSRDGVVRRLDALRGAVQASYFTSRRGSAITSTEAGFFNAHGSDPPVHIVRGLDVTMIDQVYRSLYNPDLVREALAGDPNGEVAAAARALNLDIVLDSGPAPDVVIQTPDQGANSVKDIVEVTARVADKGKGVGRIEWRVNGITAAVVEKPDGKGSEHRLTRTLALDPGENVIEVVAYNRPNLLASRPARTTVTYTGPADRAKPRLHVLAIGINSYSDQGVAGHPGFKPLNLAVKDAQTIAEELGRAASSDIYADTRIEVLTNERATRAGIAAAIDRMAGTIHPRDTFILFAAGHGTSDLGRFFLLPHDYKGGRHPTMLARHAIGQYQLQDWLANKIKAKRALILLDTCESGALVAGHLFARNSDAAASDAGVGRLHEATGRPVLTAAAKGQPAWEGLIREGTTDRHGVFTWALLDALRNGDTNRNGRIELSELVAHVQNTVPEIAKRFGGKAATRGAGAILSFEAMPTGKSGQRPSAKTTASPVQTIQAARYGSRGEDFIVAGMVK